MSQYRLIIAGTRGLKRSAARAALIAELSCSDTRPGDLDGVASGMSGTVDILGKQWAEMNGVHLESFWPDWEGLGRAAGHVRNEDMAAWAAKGPAGGRLIAIWGNDAKTGRPSRGTANMIATAHWYDLEVYVRRVD